MPTSRTFASAPHYARLPFAYVFAAIGGIYVAQSLISGLTFQALPAILRAHGLPLERIGLVSLAFLPWALKFLWAPAVERYRHGGTRDRTRTIIVVGELLVVVVLLVVAQLGLANVAAVLMSLIAAGLVCATIDIACDGYAVEELSADLRGWGNTAQVGGSYAGFMIGGGCYLWIVAVFGFLIATIALALVVLGLTLPFAALVRPRQPRAHASAHRASLGFALARQEVRLGLMLVALCGLGPRIGASLVGPFMIDRGIDLALLGILNGAASVAAGLVGTFLGGALVHASGASRAVVTAVGLQAAALGGLCVEAYMGAPPVAVLVTSMVALTAAMAMGFVAMYALLMGASSLRQAGVDFTLFQCAGATVAMIAGMSGGWLASHLGYANVFVLTVAIGAVATLTAWLVSSRVVATLDEVST
jgi:MFS transporter (putative signal transducer)